MRMRIGWRTDKPPKEEDYYLTTLDSGDWYVCRWTDRDMLTGKPGTDEWYWQPPQYTRVVAWMPLPEPYKEGEEQKITRKEAIKELEILKEDYWDDDGYGHETKQYDDTMLALDIAIQALEQESTEECSADVISKETAI